MSKTNTSWSERPHSPHLVTGALAHLAAELIPQFGATFCTLAGEAKTLAQVLLAPGDGLSRHHRRLAEAHPLVSCGIRADWQTWRPAPPPDAFHRTTLRWAIDNASHIAIWSAAFPEFADEITEWRIRAADEGARWITTVETTSDRAAEWIRLANSWKRRAAIVRVFGPSDVGGVQ